MKPYPFTSLLAVIALLLLPGWRLNVCAKPIPAEVEALHEDMWQRFVSTNGLVFDYVADLPTPEECEAGKPNAVSWWTPVENGAFFTGLYLDGIVKRWKITGADADKEKARRLANGLIQCASVGKTAGFIARFVLPDGKSHYSMGSDDQTGPWFYGLWSYVRSGIPDANEKARVTAKLVEVANALRKNRWLLPCDSIGDLPPGQYRGAFSGGEYRAATRLLFVLRAMYELTGDESWQKDYRKALEETPFKSSKTRLQIVAAGMPGDFEHMPDLAKSQLWIYINSQAILRELSEMESDSSVRASYLEAMNLNVQEAAKRLTPTNPGAPAPFNIDWRRLNAIWEPQISSDQATKVAERQHTLWKNKGRHYEIQTVREPFCAAWIIVLAPNAGEQKQAAEETLRSVFRDTQWKDIASSFGLFGESAWYQLHAPSSELTQTNTTSSAQ